MRLLLGIGAEQADRVGDVADRGRWWSAGRAQLVIEDRFIDRRHAVTAVFHGEGEAHPAPAIHRLVPVVQCSDPSLGCLR